MSIHVTMFAVGLGTSILLEFKREGKKPVRVLADGGDANQGPDVARKLKSIITSETHLDLVIGTHYDADHLDGLAEILKDKEIRVSELWLPPVADDTDIRERGREPKREALLAEIFRASPNRSALKRYLGVKERDLYALEEIEFEVLGEITEEERTEETDSRPADENAGWPRLATRPYADFGADQQMAFFYEQRTRADRVLGDRGIEHASAIDILDDGPAALSSSYWRMMLEGGERERRFFRRPVDQQVARMEVAQVRQSLADDAINAAALQRVVDSLADRPEIKVVCEYIPDGSPIVLGWNPYAQRFDRRHGTLEEPKPSILGRIGLLLGLRRRVPGEPKLTILGPTERLVAERREKLPVRALFFLADRYDRLKPLTDSNQLSYVTRFDHEGQGILITGDSGFDGFGKGSSSSRAYEPKLVDGVRGLSVIQVPHHGGINRHFYRVMMDEADFSKETRPSFLLLSHEKDSRHRPSGSFADFMRRIGDSHPTKLLFTSDPKAENVKGYTRMAASVAPLGVALGGGDVELNYDAGTWRVARHAVKL